MVAAVVLRPTPANLTENCSFVLRSGGVNRAKTPTLNFRKSKITISPHLGSFSCEKLVHGVKTKTTHLLFYHLYNNHSGHVDSLYKHTLADWVSLIGNFRAYFKEF